MGAQCDGAKDRLLEILHEAHPGMIWMKTFSTGFVWWPGIDKQIETCVKVLRCHIFCLTTELHPTAPLKFLQLN